MITFFFFFSSRRRHTRSKRDWSSDVCSSDLVGSAVQLVTNGLKATEYRPVDSDKSVDILVRFPPDRRSLDQIDDLRVQTQAGHEIGRASCRERVESSVGDGA